MTDFRALGIIFNPNNAGQLGIVNACVVLDDSRSVDFGWIMFRARTSELEVNVTAEIIDYMLVSYYRKPDQANKSVSFGELVTFSNEE